MAKMNMTCDTIVIYHSPCLDGFTAAWVAHKALGNTATYVAGSYADASATTLPDVDGKIVYLLDFSYPREVMLELAKRSKYTVVLDHHKSAQADLEDLIEDNIVGGEFDMERSGAMMAWNFFFFDQEPPEFIEYVQDRDLWRKKLPNCEEINLAMFSYEYTFENWDEIAALPISSLLKDGKAIHRKHMKDVHELIDTCEQRMTIGGFENIRTVNANHFFGSDLCAILCKEEPFAAYYSYNSDGLIVFGLRSNADYEHAQDVSIIAKAYGGGGHVNASGFRVNSLSDL